MSVTSDIKSFEAADLRPEIGIIIGTRPGIIMAAPVIRECIDRKLAHFVIHSGQHYSQNMDEQFFLDLDLPPPQYRLEGVPEKRTHGAQTAVMLDGIEQILIDRRPAVMLVYGDTNSNLAAALAARKLHISVALVEAGERSRDWRSPEEHNRKMIDAISDFLFVTGQKAAEHLRQEGIPDDRIIETGNPIVDASVQNIEAARQRSDALSRFGLEPGGYGILTLHREENVDRKDRLVSGLQGVSDAAERIDLPKLLFLAHPRTLKRLAQYDLEGWVAKLPRFQTTEAVGYLDFLNLLSNAAIAFTDSGGVQQEACIHRVPCLTLSEHTAWSETVDLGANQLVGCARDLIVAAAEKAMTNRDRDWGWPFGAGDSARKMVDTLAVQIAQVR